MEPQPFHLRVPDIQRERQLQRFRQCRFLFIGGGRKMRIDGANPEKIHRQTQRRARIRIPPASVPPSSAPLKRPPVTARARRQAERAPASVVSAAKSALASKAMLAISAAALQIRIRHLRRREDTDEVSEMFIEPVHDL